MTVSALPAEIAERNRLMMRKLLVIVVAMLGSLHPVGIVIAALFMALISAGSVTMQVKTGIPVSFTSVLEELIVLFILLGMAVSAAQSKRKKVG